MVRRNDFTSPKKNLTPKKRKFNTKKTIVHLFFGGSGGAWRLRQFHQ